MDLQDYVGTLRKYWWLIAVLTALGGVAGIGYEATQQESYRASARTFVTVNAGNSVGELVQGSTFVENSIQSFVQLTGQPIVLDPVIEALDLPVTARALGAQVTAENPLNTFFIDVSVTDSDPQFAADAANAIVEQLAVTVADLSPSTDESGRSFVELTPVAEAPVPTYSISRGPRSYAALGAAAGLALGVLAALLRRLLDSRVRDSGHLIPLGGLPVLATIDRDRDPERSATTMITSPDTTRAEGFRRLQANLEYLDEDAPARVIVVSSATQGEGKTTLCINLALAAAEKGLRVLLIDADVRVPALTERLGLPERVGLTGVLQGASTLGKESQRYRRNVMLLGAGEAPVHPSALLVSDAMDTLLHEARSRYDMVIIDSPPILLFSDTPVLARRSDGIILVARLGRLRRAQAAAAVADIEALGARALGWVAMRRPGSKRTETVQYGDPARRTIPRALTNLRPGR